MFNSCFCDASTILHFSGNLCTCSTMTPITSILLHYSRPLPFLSLPRLFSFYFSLSHSLVFFRAVFLTISTSSPYSGFSHCHCSISSTDSLRSSICSTPFSPLSFPVSVPLCLSALHTLDSLAFLSLLVVPYIFLSFSFSLIHFSITVLLTLAPFLLNVLSLSPFVCILLTSVGVKCSGFVSLLCSGFGQVTGPDAATLKHNLHNIF